MRFRGFMKREFVAMWSARNVSKYPPFVASLAREWKLRVFQNMPYIAVILHDESLGSLTSQQKTLLELYLNRGEELQRKMMTIYHTTETAVPTAGPQEFLAFLGDLIGAWQEEVSDLANNVAQLLVSTAGSLTSKQKEMLETAQAGLQELLDDMQELLSEVLATRA